MLMPLEDGAETVRRTLFERRVAAGHWEGHLSSSALATATAVTAIAEARRAGIDVCDSGRLVERGIEWLTRTANADGGWGDTPDSVSNISTTALVWAALSYGETPEVAAASEAAARWIADAAGGQGADRLAAALAARYGKDRTFSVPILTMCAIAGRLGEPDRAWRLIPQLPFELAVLPRRSFAALRLPVVSYALPALISMGLARHRCGPALPFVRGTRERAAARVLRVLDTLQPSNGGFLEAVPLTSFVTMSLLAAGEPRHPCVTRGLGFLSRSARNDGSWPIDTNLATWVTTLSINALGGSTVLSVITEEERHAVRDWLLAQQWRIEHPYTGAAPGGWAWTDLPGGVPDADDTAGALIALAHLDRESRPVRDAAAAGVRWLLDLQNRDGGIPTFCRGWGTLPFDRSSTDLTAHALRAWSAWDTALEPALRDRVHRAIRRALSFLERSQREDGAFVPLWFGHQLETSEENPVYGTGRVIKGLAAVEAGSALAQQVRRRAEQFLLHVQNPEGGWGAAAGVASSTEETAVAISALAASGASPEARAAAHRGADWLSERTNGFRTFAAAPIGLYFAKLWYAEELYPIIFATAAMQALEDTAPHNRSIQA
jgi:squalene-hopene/tetraprenyl-beta-curcumene cyclase